MSQEKLQRAATLINQKNYVAAVKLLETMPDEPQAQKWLAEMRKRGYAINHTRQEDEDIWETAQPSKMTTQLSPTPVVQTHGTGRLFRFFAGFCLLVIISLQALSLSKQYAEQGPIKIEQPVAIQGMVSVEGDEETQTQTALAVEQTIQEWEYLSVQYIQRFPNPFSSDFIEIVHSNDPAYDDRLFGEYICENPYDYPDYEKCYKNFQGQGFYLELWGNDGWELVTVTTSSSEFEYIADMIFKRPKSN